jgi:hypothetical protein
VVVVVGWELSVEEPHDPEPLVVVVDPDVSVAWPDPAPEELRTVGSVCVWV